MPASKSVLAHLARTFPQPENIATEALCFVLGRSPAARNAVVRLLASFHINVVGDILFETQVSGEAGARPDMRGRTSDQETRVVVEAKFWAGLTDHQPGGYLAFLSNARPGCLLFVAPSERFETLWPELVRRLTEGGHQLGPPAQVGPEARSVSVGNHVLALVSWRQILGSLQDAARADDDAGCASDISQLSALTEQMDSTAFLPLHSEELTGSYGRRFAQFTALIDDLTFSLVTEGLSDITRLTAGRQRNSYGRFMRLSGHAASLAFNAESWANWGQSPIWIRICGSDWSYSAEVAAALTTAGKSFQSDHFGCHIPIVLKTLVERPAVIADALMQIRRIAAALPKAPAAGHAPPIEDDTPAGSV